MSGVLAAALGFGAPGLLNQSSWADAADPGGASLNVNNDGTFDGSGSPGGDWVTPALASVAAFYQIKVDATSGSFSSGTTGTWLDLSSTQSWSRNAGDSVGFALQIREKLSTLVRLSITGTLDAT